MQTDAPRADGGVEYRGLRLRGDVLGTTDGLAKQAYYREGYRIKAQFTVLEQHIGVAARAGFDRAETFMTAWGRCLPDRPASLDHRHAATRSTSTPFRSRSRLGRCFRCG